MTVQLLTKLSSDDRFESQIHRILIFYSFSRSSFMLGGSATYGLPSMMGSSFVLATGGSLRSKIAYSVITVVMFFSLSVAFERRAYAYVDPGSGLLMLQAAGTVVTGVLFTLRRRIKSLFTRNKSAETQPIESISPESKA